MKLSVTLVSCARMRLRFPGAVHRTFDYGADVVPGSALVSHDST
jgi:hypothetical protein